MGTSKFSWASGRAKVAVGVGGTAPAGFESRVLKRLRLCAA